MISGDFRRRLEGYGLTTATILYRVPDYPSILQTMLWQFEDFAPTFPRLIRFLDFWGREVDGALHSVTVCHSRLIRPAELKVVDGEFRIH